MDETPSEYVVNPPSNLTEREKRFRTKIDVLWDDVLEAAAGNAKEIRDVTTRVERLSGELPAFIDSVGDKLNTQSGHYLAAAEKLAAVLHTMSQEIDRAASQAAVTATESAKLDIRQAAAAAAAEAVGQAVGGEISKVIGHVNNATDNLVNQASAAKQEIMAAGRSTSWGFGRILAMVVAGGCISGLVMLGGANYLLKPAVAIPDPETARQIEAGRDFLALIPQLNAPMRAEIIRMVEKNRRAVAQK